MKEDDDQCDHMVSQTEHIGTRVRTSGLEGLHKGVEE